MALTVSQGWDFFLKRSITVIMDIDKDGYITGVDLFLLLGLWFTISLTLLVCYACFDVIDRSQRKKDLRNWTERDMLVVPKDALEGSDEEDTFTDSDSLDEVDVDCNGGCVSYTADLPIVKDLA